VDRELELRAERAVASGKVGMARLYLQMALEEAAGARRESLRAKLAALSHPTATAQVAGAPSAATR
jgi:hypothetical protein